MNRALGWDIHRKFSRVSLQELDEFGEIRVVQRARLEHDDPQRLRAWLAQLARGTAVAMEAAFGWPWVADLLDEIGLEPHLGHPPAIRVLARNEAKADRCDADRLGRFWLQGIFPESYLAPPDVRALRERTRYRSALVVMRGGLKNRIQAILHRQGILHSFSDLFGKAGRAFLAQLALPAATGEALGGYLRLLDVVQQEIDQVETWMEAHVQEDAVTQRLMTIPGIGRILAHVLQAELGELPERFPSAKHLASYAGLAPLSNDSADRHGRRHISRACNHALRWAFLEAANSIISHCDRRAPRLLALYDRLSHHGRCNKGQAKVAIARELSHLVYVIWKKGEPYRCPEAMPCKGKRLRKRTAIRVRSDEPRHPMARTAWKPREARL